MTVSEKKFGMHEACLAEEISPFDYEQKFIKINTNQDLSARNVAELARTVTPVLEKITCSSLDIEKDIKDFIRYVENSPAADHRGSTQAGSLLWLYLISKNLKPSVLVESGVLVGTSLHCFRYACPNAKIHAFDINLKRLLFEDDSINFHEMDWSQVEVEAESENDFCFFDDHINNALRIVQAHERGFKNLVFDDSPNIGELHKFRYPGVPTVPMIVSENLKDGDCLEWFHVPTEKHLRYTFKEEHVQAARDLIDFVVRIPNIQACSSLNVGIQHFVRLK